MASVIMLPAKKRVGGRIVHDETPKTRVAAYCRVSTDTDEQATSYEAQVEHYTKYIKQNPAWDCAGIYADDGISGTNTKKRESFNRLIKDCMDGKIDMVLTKSISRFARNTLDCLNYIRKLKDKNIAVFFEKEGINTLDAKGEVMLTIMASLAQQESESLSQNVRLGFQYRFQQGKVMVNHNRFLGYDKDENGKLIINKAEAEVVKRIYREYLEGQSYYSIGRGLTKDGIKTAAGKTKWLASTLRKILSNEKYMGDALLQKTITTDFLTKKRVINHGIAPQYYVEDDHEAIIPKDLFMRVQEEMARRASLETNVGRRRLYSGMYALSNTVFCAHCGEVFQRTQWNISGNRKHVWRCLSRLHKKNAKVNCHARTLNETDLHAAVVKAVNEVYAKQDDFMVELQANIEKVLLTNNSAAVAEIDEKILKKKNEILRLVKDNKNCDVQGDEIVKLREERYNLILEDVNKAGSLQKIEDLKTFLAKQSAEVQEYDDSLVRRLIDTITVYDDHLKVKFKSGIEVEVRD
jgi:DNA invertase Pin-like site-specific DNA recombinase